MKFKGKQEKFKINIKLNILLQNSAFIEPLGVSNLECQGVKWMVFYEVVK